MRVFERSVAGTVALSAVALALVLGFVSAFAPPRLDAGDDTRGAEERAMLPRPDLRVMFTGSLEGFLEPCGCTAGRLGGFDRIATKLDERRAGAPNAIYIDCGDTFVSTDDLTRTLQVQLPIKADAIMGILAEAGCEAMALGDYDLAALGVKALQGLSERHGVPILCANLVDESGARVFKLVHIVERGGLRVGVFSLLAQNLTHPDPDNSSVIKVGETVEELGLRLLPWRNVARELVEYLEGKVDVIVCASHLGAAANLELVELCPQIDIVCGPHWEGLTSHYVAKGTSLVSYVSLKGGRVTTFDRWWGGTPPRPEAHGELGEDVTSRVEAAIQRAVTIDGLRNLMGRESVLGLDTFEQRRMAYEAYIAQADAYLMMAGEFPSARAYSVTLQTVHRNLERDEFVLERLDEYHRDLEAFWLSRPTTPKAEDSPFVDPSRCTVCHPDQYEFWKSTSHSRAYSTLAITQQQYDAECFACHTVGIDQPGGFRHPREAAGFENVQCAACHGPGGEHMRGGVDYLAGRQLLKVGSTCTQCHDKTHDPVFFDQVLGLPGSAAQVQEKLARVSCPKMPAPGLGTPEFRAALAEAGDALRALPEVPWSEVVSVYHRAGESEAAIAAAERFVATSNESPPALRTLGLLLIDNGLDEEGAAQLERALPNLGDDPQARLALAGALLTSDPARALFHAREAHSLVPHLASAAAAVARSLVATDDGEGARSFLEGHLELHPAHREELQPLLDELR